MPVPRCLRLRLSAFVIVLLTVLLSAAAAGADQPDHLHQEWTPTAPAVSPRDLFGHSRLQAATPRGEIKALVQQPARFCDEIALSEEERREIGLIATDADLVRESDGSRLCVFFDFRWGGYFALALNARTLEQFRETKRQLQPLLSTAGIDPCQVTFWSSESRTVNRQITLPDRFDAGRPCPVAIEPHGAESERRRREVEETIATAAATAERVFGWRLTWPLRVHLYDTLDSFAAGVREEGGDEDATPDSLDDVSGITAAPLASGGFGQMINLDDLDDPSDLRWVVAHEYAHVAQAGLLGDADFLPFFVTEGGAEYFASLIVGADQSGLTRRFRIAMNDERLSLAVPLREIVATPRDSDEQRLKASYTRGYAAMRYLVAEWGPESYSRLHRENIDGTPERFLEAMSRLTGKSLDAFDGELRRFLLAEAAKPATVGRVTFAANSRLVEAGTARVGADGDPIEVDRYTRADSRAIIAFGWECLPAVIAGEARVIAPDGRLFAGFHGTNGPGCDSGGRVDLALDAVVGGRIARTLPGVWTVEIYAEGVFQGSITFVLE